MNNVISFEIRTLTRPGRRDAAWMFGSECEGRLYLGSERLATDPDDRDITGTLRMFNLPTAVAPGEWPNPGEGVTTDEDPRHRGE
jgi:hypothetical protein